MPVNARRRNRKLIEFQDVLVNHSEQSAFNQLTLRGPKGIIACGVGNNYVKEAIGEDSDYSILKISAYPIPQKQVRQIVDHCESILLVEEGYPLLETKLRGLLGVPGKTIQGRCSGELPPDGELSANLIKAALNLPLPSAAQPLPALPNRPPSLCQGCPHCDTFKMITDALPPGESPLLFGDIGCYTLGALPPYDAVHTCVEMGASVGMGLGAAKAGAHPVICTIGDSTFTHSGMTTLLAAAAENANMTVIIMDNAGVAMTGGQDAFITGEDFIRLLRGLGADPRHIMQIDPVRKDHERNVQILKDEIAYRGLSVIIATRPCIHLKRRAQQSGAKEREAESEPRTRPGAAMEKVPI
jgi:indolepyruvate ferredoxin oxidoreductase alpha subunit